MALSAGGPFSFTIIEQDSMIALQSLWNAGLFQ